jgi:hypothetical protein
VGTITTARVSAAALAALAAALLSAPVALADATSSSNWAGYAVHGNGISYRTVQGSWRQPSATCARGLATYSSYWVGIGGYSQTSNALEQIGTELDCTASGQVRSTAWYELVPAPSTGIALDVHPGDLMNASVTVVGNHVSMSLTDVTRKHGFTRTSTTSSVDVSSAEWIVEAPSACLGANACQTLPLANFGTAAFDSVQATSTGGVTGGLSSPAWQLTKIRLVPSGRRFVGNGGSATSVGTATPSAFGANGHSFKVSYALVSLTSGSPLLARPSPLRAGDVLRH